MGRETNLPVIFVYVQDSNEKEEEGKGKGKERDMTMKQRGRERRDRAHRREAVARTGGKKRGEIEEMGRERGGRR